MEQLRPAESGDFERLVQLYCAGRVVSEVASQGRFEPFEARQRVGAWFRDADVQVLEAQGTIRAALAVDWDADPVELLAVDVAENQRGRGLGTRIVADVIRRARSSDRDVSLRVLRTNPARRLFARMGFVREAEDDLAFHMRWAATVEGREALRQARCPWEDAGRRGAWLAHLFARDDEAASFVEFAIRRAELSRPLRMLELGGAWGLRLPTWARLADEVRVYAGHGNAAAAAGRMAACLGASITVVPGHVQDLADVQPFDVAVALDGEIARLLTPKARRAAAAHLRAMLRPGGMLVVAVPNWPVHVSRVDASDPQTLESPLGTVSRIPKADYDFHRGQVRLRTSYVVELEAGELATIEEDDRQALIDRPHLVDLLEQAGFVGIETFTDYSSTAVGRAIRGEIILVAYVPLTGAAARPAE